MVHNCIGSSSAEKDQGVPEENTLNKNEKCYAV